MPRQKQKNRNRRRAATLRLGQGVVARNTFRMQGTALLNFVFTSQAFYTLQVYPSNISARVASLASSFELFRFNQLKFKTYPIPVFSASAQVMGMAYDPIIPTNSPTTLTHLSEMTGFQPVFPTQTVASTMSLPHSVLFRQPIKWWNTAGSSNLYQGVFYLATANAISATITVEVAYDIEFASPVYTGKNELPQREETKQAVYEVPVVVPPPPSGSWSLPFLGGKSGGKDKTPS